MRAWLFVGLVAVFALSGCFGNIPARVDVVFVEDVIDTEPEKMHDADFGPHCALASFGGAPMTVHLNAYQESGRPDLVLLRHYVSGPNTRMGMDGSLDAHWSDEERGTLALLSPIVPTTVFANVSWSPEGIIVDDEALVAGRVHERHYEYEAVNTEPRPSVLSPGDPMGRVVETMRFTWHPETRVTWDDGRGRLCM